MDLPSFFFKNRSYTPIPIILGILYYSEPNYPFWLCGFFLILFGELIRFWAVRYAGGRTRTKNVGANLLCTSGPYSRTRNPLYIGNLIIYTGVVLFSGGVHMIQFLILVIVYFTFQYSMIISLEEQRLLKLFGQSYANYKNHVPRIIPLLKPWTKGSKITPASISKTLTTEKRTLQNIIILFCIIIAKPYIPNFTF